MKDRNRFCRTIAVCLCMAALAGCQKSTEAGTAAAGTAAAEAAAASKEDVISDWKSQDYKTIKLEDGDAEINNSGIYELTGTLEDGSVTVNVDKNLDSDTVYLVLSNATIGSRTTAPIYIKEAEKVVLLLEDGTASTVTQGSSITTDESGNPSSAIFSKADLTIAGNGSLTVTSEYNDGITSRDDLIILGGTITVSAEGDGITGKDMIAVETADITITAGKDGMRSTNDTDASKGNITISDGSFHITAGNDAIQAEQVLQVDGGNFDLSSGGGYPGESTAARSGTEQPVMESPADEVTGSQPESQGARTETGTTEESDSRKSLKAGSQLIINGGNFTISSYEDSLHSNGDITINSGSFTMEAGDDGIHADAAVIIEKGEITISAGYEGIEGSEITIKDGNISIVSSDDGINVSSQSGTLTIDGGTITVAAGGDGLDSNGNIVQNGGTVTIDTDAAGPGDTPVDYDGTFTSNGGTVVDQNGDVINYENQQMGGGHGGMTGGDGQLPPEGRKGGTPPDGVPGDHSQKQKGGVTDESSSENL